MSSSLIERLSYFAEHHPDHEALASPTVSLSYAQLATLVTVQIKSFYAQGIAETSVVGIKCANDIQHLIACLAATHIGATSCTIPSHEVKQVQVLVSTRCKVSHIIDANMIVSTTSSATRYTTGDETPAIRASSACLLFSTSGTTGEPKLVVHHDSDLVAQAHRHVGSMDERFACLASVEHNFAKRHRLYAIAMGATNVFLDSKRDSITAQCQALSVNVLHVSAFQAQDLLAQSNINQLVNIRLKLGGSHVPLSLRKQLKDNITNNLQAGYGTTETGAIAFTDPSDDKAGESVGQPLPGIEIRIVRPDRKPLATGERGEVAIRCAGMFRAYLGNPELTATRLEDDWFYTGDIGYLDKHQRIYLCGRSDDMFVFNSMNIYPQDIESTILQHPHISEVAVIPKASPVHGNIPVALLVFRQNVKQRLPEIQKFVQKRVGVRSPRQYIIVQELPKTASGKISRANMLDLPKKSGEIRSDILGMLDPKVTGHLKPSRLSAFKNGDKDILMKHIEMDSLDRMNFLVAIELEYETIITPQEFRAYRCLSQVVAQILSQPSQRDEDCSWPQSDAGKEVMDAENQPHEVLLFQRTFRFCHTVAQLNKALTSLEQRLTPLGVKCLCKCHSARKLVPTEAATKFQTAVSRWLQAMQDAIQHSGKVRSEPFSLRRISTAANFFFVPGDIVQKTLLICFPPRDIRQMGIPNPILLQHTDSQQYDVLVISTSFLTGYHHGKSQFKTHLTQFSQWVKTQNWIQQYRSIRTLGYSAGGRTALAAGYMLNADLAVSVSGRFHRKRFILENVDQLITIWRAMLSGSNSTRPHVLLSYTTDNRRDRLFARLMAKITGGRKLVIEHKHEKLKHLVLQQLLKQGNLATYLSHTVFAETHNGQSPMLVDLAIQFPTGQLEMPKK